MLSDLKKIEAARQFLGLGPSATIGEIRDAYRKLAVKYHPDKCRKDEKQEHENMFKKINRANEILMRYCANYRFSFSEDDVKRTDLNKENYEHMKRFYDGWWGDLG